MEKDERHEDDVIATGGQFYPLVAETLGYWFKDAKDHCFQKNNM